MPSPKIFTATGSWIPSADGCPSGSVFIECFGQGATSISAFTGGGGGAYSSDTITLDSATEYFFRLEANGTSYHGTNGMGSAVILAKNGEGNGNGGAAASGVGAVTRSGGNGGTGGSSEGGGGGGAAGSVSDGSNGANGVSMIGGAGGVGGGGGAGAGGTGGSGFSGAGTAGSSYGGGGGGGTFGGAAGSGAGGAIRFSWDEQCIAAIASGRNAVPWGSLGRV